MLYETLSDVQDQDAKPVRIQHLIHVRTGAFPGALETVLHVGRESATFDAGTAAGRAVLDDLIASLLAIRDMGAELEQAGFVPAPEPEATVEQLDDDALDLGGEGPA